MNEILIFLAGIALGTYFSEPIKDSVPILDKEE